MNLDDIYGSNLLEAKNLNGQERTLTISGWKLSKFKDTTKQKIVLTFHGTEDELVLNVTNAKRIAATHKSDNPDAWAGKQITIYPDEVEFGGEIVPCIRVRIPAPVPVEDQPQVSPQDTTQVPSDWE